MRLALFLLASYSAILPASAAVDLPPEIKKCPNDDTLNDCIMKNSKEAIEGLLKGYPKLGIPVLEPLKIDKIQQTTRGTRAVAMNFTLNDINVYGLSKAEIVKSEFDTTKHIIQFSSMIPELKIFANYILNGKFLVVPVTGNGKITITLDSVFFTFSVTYKIEKRKGTEYMSVNLPPKIIYSVAKGTLDFENLFNGDKALGASFNALVNENWKEWDAQVGPGIAEALGLIIGSILEKASNAVPYRNFFA